MKTLTFLFVLIFYLNASGQSSYKSKKMDRSSFNVEVKEVKWTTTIENNQAGNELKGKVSTSDGLVLWASLIGDGNALDYILTRHELPIQFKVFKNSVLGLTPERFYVIESNLIAEGEEVETKSIEIKLNDKEISRKMSEVKSKGSFEFYVWARFTPERLKGADRLTASIVLKDNSTVKCPQENCEYSIMLR